MRPRRVDANHKQIADALRQCGAVVIDIHALPGVLDLIAIFRGNTTILEVKDGTKKPSARVLTPAEQETIALIRSVGGRVEVVESVEGALRAIGAIGGGE